MNLCQDKVPHDLVSSCSLLLAALDTDEITHLLDGTFSPSHYSALGELLADIWSLHDAETHLVKWFYKHFGFVSAQEITVMVLSKLVYQLNGVDFDELEHARIVRNKAAERD